MRALLLVALACIPLGCGSSPPKLEDARAAVQRTGEGLERARAGMLAVCDERPPLPPLSPATRVRCDDAIDGLTMAVEGYQLVRKAVP